MKTIVCATLPPQAAKATYGSVIGKTIREWRRKHQTFCYYASMAWKIPWAACLVIALIAQLIAQLARLAKPHVLRFVRAVQDLHYEDRGLLYGLPVVAAALIALVGFARYMEGMSLHEHIRLFDWVTTLLS